VAPDFRLTISVRDGEKLAQKTWNPRLGILGGLSILGTTGIVIPYSCSAWIHSIHRGVDVARALGLDHVVGSVGDTSERAAMAHLGLAIEAYLDMGDFVGGMLKYLKAHPVARVTIAGGFAKLSKLAQGVMDLHSARGGVDLDFLAGLLGELGADADLIARARTANTAKHALDLANSANLPLADRVADRARLAAQKVVGEAVHVAVLVVDRAGNVIGESG
jgi:cobalt-precorrin-5B (C1)-methyltransferase